MNRTVAFDVIGTLFSLDRIRDEVSRIGAPVQAVDLWYAQSLRDYFASSYAGGYVPFAEVLQAALPRALAVFEVEISGARAGEVTAKMRELDLVPGGGEAFSTLRAAGCMLVALSNGSLEATNGLLERAGVAADFSAVRSSDEAEASKPAAATYELAREASGGGELWMVAAHAWDIAGARRAGMRTAWVAGVESEYLPTFPRPDMEATDLCDAARKLLTV